MESSVRRSGFTSTKITSGDLDLLQDNVVPFYRCLAPNGAV